MSDDVILANNEVMSSPVNVKGTSKKKKTTQTELAPMVTHWKPTGQNCYRIDMKPTVIRRRDSMPAPRPYLPQRLGVADLKPPVPRPQAVPLRSIPASPRELQAWSTTSPRRSDMWRPKSSSLESPNSTEKIRRMREERYACAACSAGHCCQTRGCTSACAPECPCALVLAWQQLETSLPSSPRPQAYTPDPSYVQAWSDVPRKCDPQVWLSVRTKPKSRFDQQGANFRWMGWNFVPDFLTAQSCYG